MKLFEFWTLPFPEKKGAFDKWEKQESIEAKGRKAAVETIIKMYKDGTWRLRLGAE
tara:strand:+ start:5515 stop:5682 length:168 start_codon:yes stop_codon:yes gene_type:complete